MKKNILFLWILFTTFLSCTYAEEYSIFRKDGLYGIIDEDRAVVMEPIYDWISINSNSIVCSKDRTKEIYNKSLELLFYGSGVKLTYFNENQIMIKESVPVKTWLLDVETGDLTVYELKKNYSEENGYRENVGLVWRENNGGYSYSIVDVEGNVLLTDIEDAHSCYTNGMIAVILKNGKSGFVNTKGEMVIAADFYIEPSDEGLRKEPIIRYLFNEDYALVKNLEQKWVQYNIKGEKKSLLKNIKPVEYSYKNGLVPVMDIETKKYGYMNPKLKIVIPCELSYAKAFDGKYAIVVHDGKDAVIDTEGNIYYCDEFSK